MDKWEAKRQPDLQWYPGCFVELQVKGKDKKWEIGSVVCGRNVTFEDGHDDEWGQGDSRVCRWLAKAQP